MLWLTPALLLFEAPLGESGCVVEVLAEICLPRRGERDGRGLALEPDEPLHAVLHRVEPVEGALPPNGWAAYEAALEEEALEQYRRKEG